MTRQQFAEIIRTMKKLTLQDIDLFVAGLNAEILAYVESIPAEARLERLELATSPTPVGLKEVSSSFFQKYYQDVLFSGEESATEVYFKKSLSSGFDIDGMETAIADAAAKYSVALHQSQSALSAFLRKDFAGYSQTLASMKQSIPVTFASLTTPSDSAEEEVLTLSEAWVGFLKFKSDWKPKIRQGNEKYFEVIKSVLGADTPVANITRRDIKNLLEIVEGLPRQNKRPYNSMTIQQCLDLDDVPEDDVVSPKTVKDYLKLCQGLFSTYLTVEIGVFETPPTNSVRYEAQSKSYGNYSRTEMRKLVEHFATLEDWKKWVFLLLSYTGARRAEISKLIVSDVRFDDDSQWHYIMIEDSKTDSGTRQVPLAPRLIDMGFLNYLEGKRPNEKLFPQITNNTQLTRIFHVIRETLGIEYMDDYKSRRIVHSLRHTFITEAQKTNNTLLVQQVVGHEHSQIGQTQRYTHRYTVSDLLPVVKELDWSM
ncbi:tyrosine-type recombinase/integrase [Enterobacter mori]|uniref:tyrosine-type recombinase/integrase n=1 Tax=Enterobacter mori TaxID=539813 RepID=UPI003978B925